MLLAQPEPCFEDLGLQVRLAVLQTFVFRLAPAVVVASELVYWQYQTVSQIP